MCIFSFMSSVNYFFSLQLQLAYSFSFFFLNEIAHAWGLIQITSGGVRDRYRRKSQLINGSYVIKANNGSDSQTQWSTTLLLEIDSPACFRFSSNVTHLIINM